MKALRSLNNLPDPGVLAQGIAEDLGEEKDIQE